MEANTNTVKFEAGNVYSCNSIGDSNCWWHFEVVRRTAKSVWIREVGSEEVKRKAVSVSYDGSAETISPLGSYSMAPSLKADQNVNRGNAFPLRLV